MVKEAIVGVHGAGIENSVERCLDLVFEGKAVPSELSVLVLEDASIEAAKHVRRVKLGIRTSDRRLEVGCQVVAVQANGRF